MLSKNLLTRLGIALALGCGHGSATGGTGGTGSGGDGDLGAITPGATGDLGAPPTSDLAAPGLLYDSDGPEPYQQLQMTATGSGKSIAIVVYLPSTAGPRPVVVLSSGLQQPAAAYAPYARRLASWGILTVLRDDPGLLAQSPSVADDLAFVVGWLPGAVAGRVDSTHVGLAGHSRGGMASLLAAEGALAGKLSGFCGLDPVDNSGGAAATLGTIGIPSLFLGETTDDGSGGGMACAPADQNYAVLYQAAPSPSVEVTAIGADHTQFEDPQSCSFCTLCTKGSADGAVVLRYSVRYLTAFFARELLGDTRVGAHLEGAGLPDDVAAGRVTTQSK